MPNFDSNILIMNIRKLMETNNITQQQLADILGMSQSNISKKSYIITSFKKAFRKSVTK